MDENTRFLVERMDRHHEQIRSEIAVVRRKIDSLSGFKNRVVGASLAVTTIVSGVVSFVLHFITGK